MRLVLKLVLPGLSNAEVCGGEVIGDDGKASILAPGAGRRRRGRFFTECISSHGACSVFACEWPPSDLARLSWQGLVGKSFTPIYGIAKESQRRHLRSMCNEIPSKYAPPFLPCPNNGFDITFLTNSVSSKAPCRLAA